MKDQTTKTNISSSLFDNHSDEVTTVDIAREISIKRNKMRLKILYWTLPIIIICIASGLYYTLNMGKASAQSEEQEPPHHEHDASDFTPPFIINVTSMGGVDTLSPPMKDVLRQGTKEKPSEIKINEIFIKENEPAKFEIEINGETFTNQEDYKGLADFINMAYAKKFPRSIVPLAVKLDDDYENRIEEDKEKTRLREESVKTDTILVPASPDSPGWSMKHEISLPDVE